MISVVIPALNEAAYLPRLLDSIGRQTYDDFEAIVVDGGSTDETVALASARQDRYPLRVLTTGRADVSLQRNAGAREARGEWLLFVDADGVLMPYALQRCADFIAEEDAAFFTAWCRADTELRRDALLALAADMLYEASLRSKRPFSPGPFTAIRKDVFDRVGGYTEGHPYQEDLELSLRVAQAGVGLKILPETIYSWSTRRVHRYGVVRTALEWAYVGLYVAVLRRPLRRLHGYATGGEAYAAHKAGSPRWGRGHPRSSP